MRWPANVAICLLSAAALLSATPVGAQGGSAPQTEPSAYELEVWRAAARLHDAEAYRAYLAQFPQGAFAEMARLSIARLRAGERAPTAAGAASGASGTTGAAGAAGAAAAADSTATPSPAALDRRALLEQGTQQPETGALTFVVGDRFVGPGAVTVGWLGARRQILLPRGEWVVLAAFDHRIGGFATLHLTSIAFGRFEGSVLRTLWLTTFNSRSPPVAGGGLSGPNTMPRWTPIDACEAGGRPGARREQLNSGGRRWCALAHATPAPPEATALAPGTMDRVDAALRLLRATRPELRTRLEAHGLDRMQGFVSYLRLEAPSSAATDAAADAAWLRGFLPLAAAADERRLGNAELVPDQALPPSKLAPDLARL